MNKKITYSDFIQALKGTIYEKNYGLVLNALAHHEHIMWGKYKDSSDKYDKEFAEDYRRLGNAIHDFLDSKGYYDH